MRSVVNRGFGAEKPSIIPVFDPATGEQIGEIHDGGASAVDQAVARARESFDRGVWRNLPATQRAQILWRAADLIQARVEELVGLESRNNGMARSHARTLIIAATEMLRYCAGWCTKLYGQSVDLRIGGGITSMAAEYHAYTVLEPIGVAGLIIPWNGPVFNALMKLAPALAAGCSCVLKPAEETPLTAVKLGEMLRDAGVPDGVINIVNGYGETTGAAIASHPGIDKIAFTGSTATGKLIVQAACGNLKRVMLELGGKSPAIVFNDADLSKVIPGAALGIFANSGQVCACTSRIYVQRGVYQQVVDGLAAAARSLRLGGSEDDNADIGPLISDKQRQRVFGIVEEGRRDGATIVSGGKPLDRPGYFFEPTIMTGVRSSMRAVQEEIFGPVGMVIPFDDEEAVIKEANDTAYGLTATVWTRDIGRAHRLAKRLQAGTVWLNCQLAIDFSIPMGGQKQSGWGHEYGWKGVEAYLNTKAVYAEI